MECSKEIKKEEGSRRRWYTHGGMEVWKRRSEGRIGGTSETDLEESLHT